MRQNMCMYAAAYVCACTVMTQGAGVPRRNKYGGAYAETAY